MSPPWHIYKSILVRGAFCLPPQAHMTCYGCKLYTIKLDKSICQIVLHTFFLVLSGFLTPQCWPLQIVAMDLFVSLQAFSKTKTLLLWFPYTLVKSLQVAPLLNYFKIIHFECATCSWLIHSVGKYFPFVECQIFTLFTLLSSKSISGSCSCLRDHRGCQVRMPKIDFIFLTKGILKMMTTYHFPSFHNLDVLDK